MVEAIVVATIGVTGHRVLSDVERVASGIDRAWRRVRARFAGLPLTILSALAEGADRLVVARALADGDVRLVVPLPVAREQYLEDFETAASRAEFERLAAHAAEVIDLPPQPTRDLAYHAAGAHIVAASDALIAVWDGRPAQGPGGTGALVAAARRRGLPIAWVHAGNREPGTTEPTTLEAMQGAVSFERL